MKQTALILLIFLCAAMPVAAADDLQAKIDARNADIKQIEKEIAGYQKQIDDLGSQAKSLSATLRSLDLTQKKIAADIQVTESRIDQKNLLIQQLSTDIVGKERTIDGDRRVINESLSVVNEVSGQSVPGIVLSSNTLSGFWNSFDEMGTLQANIINNLASLRQAKADLEHNKSATEKAKADLVSLNNDLNNQRKLVLSTEGEKNKLLKDTRDSESAYQAMLAEKKAQKDAFEKEVLTYESQLNLRVDTTKLPHVGSGALAWPLDKVTITQYFGNTPFATANPQIYNGQGHTGIDLAASIGTPVRAAAPGIVSGVANTDIVPGCYSYGKWVMVRHANGLSTLYAHLSLQAVSVGDTVTTGSLLGYSGNTGYTTGPHLHFGVYATEGVQITNFQNSKNCRGAIIPLASFNAYLNPLSYL